MEGKKFTGPLFIVGMSRSGTKLLRDVLNNHSSIAILPNETKVIPYYYHQSSRFDNYKDKESFDKFFNEFSGTTFYRRLRSKGLEISKEEWINNIEEWSYADIINAFFKSYAAKQNCSIYGDKTPGYHAQILLLKKIFAGSKFIHIVRDVRDAGLSSKSAFGKNIYRYSQRWRDSVKKYLNEAKQIPDNDHLEVKYESLLRNPADTLKEICRFLNVDYQDGMDILKRPAENYGDARGKTVIVGNNYEKWKKNLSEDKIRKIESITFDVLDEFEYSYSYKGDLKRLSAFSMAYYKIIDGLSLYKTALKNNEDGLNILQQMNLFTKGYRKRVKV